MKTICGTCYRRDGHDPTCPRHLANALEAFPKRYQDWLRGRLVDDLERHEIEQHAHAIMQNKEVNLE